MDPDRHGGYSTFSRILVYRTISCVHTDIIGESLGKRNRYGADHDNEDTRKCNAP